MLFLRLDQGLQLLGACQTLKETLAIRYFMYNGLSPMELAAARIEHLDPVTHYLFLPRVHWKDNQVKHIESETVRLQIIYSAARKKGPLLRSRKTKGHFTPRGLWRLVKRVARRTNILGKEKINPLILKRTFAREYLLTEGNTLGGLQRAFCHKSIWSTAHYLRFVLEDVRRNHTRMMERIEHGEKAESVRPVPR